MPVIPYETLNIQLRIIAKSMQNILDKIEFWAHKFPDRTMYSFLDVNGVQLEQYSYQEFEEKTNAIASYLSQYTHLKSSERVLLLFPPGLGIMVAFFSCIKLGLIPVPVAPPLFGKRDISSQKMQNIISDCSPSLILTDTSFYNTLLTVDDNILHKAFRWINIDNIKNESPFNFKRSYSEILFLQYTSGSTSNPKGVRVTHKNILHNNTLVFDHEQPVGISWLPQYHDMGLIGYYLFVPLLGGTTIGFSPQNFIQRPGLWFETITKYRGTASSAPNFAYDYCLIPSKISENTLNNTDLSSLKFLMTAAEHVKQSTYTLFIERFKNYGLNPKHFFAAYGLAENTLAVTNYGKKIISVDKAALQKGKISIRSPKLSIGNTTQFVSSGKSLGDIELKIVDPETHFSMEERNVGEIWISGMSKCSGYWNKPYETKRDFEATIIGPIKSKSKYIRTGDLGFLYKNELFICGRIKDTIKIRGINYFPQDIEDLILGLSENIKTAVAFGFTKDSEDKLAVILGIRNKNKLPDHNEIINAVKSFSGLNVDAIGFVVANAIPKTSSGKLMRYKVKSDWLENKLSFIKEFRTPDEDTEINKVASISSEVDAIRLKYNLSGFEQLALVDILDSLELATLLHEIQRRLSQIDAKEISKIFDIELLQTITVKELFDSAKLLESNSPNVQVKIGKLYSLIHKRDNSKKEIMLRNDASMSISIQQENVKSKINTGIEDGILLTGGTGFFGPFLVKSLLEQTNSKIFILVRSPNESVGIQRIKNALKSTYPNNEFNSDINCRIQVICGDLEKDRLGLHKESWSFLSDNIASIYHNGAIVNYLLNYGKMRASNVLGTKEVIKLASHGRRKSLNHISTTFTFGWATKSVLFESDTNENLDLLDFGYSQSKWVSEKLVQQAMLKGLVGRIFRPALITPSVNGQGYNFDISVRLLSFMINHRMTVKSRNQVSFTPADVAANNIVAISLQPRTEGKTFHVTRDRYSNMMDITDIISKLTGIEFEKFDLKEFIPEVIRRCTSKDLLFPLISFLDRSVDKIAAMEFKRYNSDNYQAFRNSAILGRQDPSLEDTVKGILRFLKRYNMMPENLQDLVFDSRI